MNEKKISIVVWGTGGQAGGILNYNKDWLVNVNIECFVNNTHKSGTFEEFYSREIISPDELKYRNYDYIVIMSSYVKEITNQIISDLNISKEKIITLDELAKECSVKCGKNIIGKNVLLYGKKYTDFNYIYHIKNRTASIKIIMDVTNEEVFGEKKIDISEIQEEAYDYILLLNSNESEKKSLMSSLAVNGINDMECVIEKKDWLMNLAYDCIKKNKNDDSKKYFAVTPRPNDGLMGNLLEFLRACAYAEDRGYIPFVDMQNTFSFYQGKGEHGKVNVWERFFTQTLCVDNRNINEIYESENVVIPSMFFRANYYRDVIENKKALQNMRELNKKYFKIKSEVLETINKEYKRLFHGKENETILGCIYRGTDYTSIKPANHMVQPEIEEFMNICEQKFTEWNCNYIFIATEDEIALQKCKEKFGDRLLYTNQLRYSNTGNKFLAEIKNNRADDAYLRGVEYLTAIYILSKTEYIVCGQNGGSYGAFVLKDNDFKDIYVFQKGKYEVTNAKYV